MRWVLVLAMMAACNTGNKAEVDEAEGNPQRPDPATTDVYASDGSTVDTGSSSDSELTETGTQELPTVDTALPGDPLLLTLAPPTSVNNGRFATADVCAECHDNVASSSAMQDEDGRGVAPYDLWESSMMANAGRDPLWRAQMSAEIAAVPAAEAAIGEKCTRCHAPMASQDAALAGSGPLAADVLIGGGDSMHLALDGVSCTMCHQIEPDGLGDASSFDGGYVTTGSEVAYGPHANPFAHPMENHSGFTPTESSHIMDGGLCATCHTLTTHAVDVAGVETGGSIVEQAPYLEQSMSDYADTSCQSCHLPTDSVDGEPIATDIAHNPHGGDFPPVSPRSPYGRHVLVGGNTLIPSILRDWSAVLQPRASAAAFDATIAAARTQLAERTGAVAVEGLVLEGDELRFDALVTSFTGHKLPTGIPVRRVWLRTQITDATGAEVFVQGGWDGSGRIVDAAGTPLDSEAAGGPVRPHVDQVEGPEDVVIYEAVMADAAGDATFRLLGGEGWVKDNRLLPAGFDRAQAVAARIDAVGVDGDADFVGGSDRVHYTLDVTGAQAPLTVEVELVYQPLSVRWAEELFASGTPEALAFQVMYESAERGPERISMVTMTAP